MAFSLRQILGESNLDRALARGLECEEEDSFENSLQRDCIRAINKYIRLRSRIKLLPLPALLKEWCEHYYVEDRRRQNRVISSKIIFSLEYQYLKSILRPYGDFRFYDNFYNEIFAIHSGYIIKEQPDLTNDENNFFYSYLPVRYVCENCFFEFYNTNSKFPDVEIKRFREFKKIRITYMFFIFHHQYFCHECYIDLIDFPLRDLLENVRIIQFMPLLADEITFINMNPTIVYPTI